MRAEMGRGRQRRTWAELGDGVSRLSLESDDNNNPREACKTPPLLNGTAHRPQSPREAEAATKKKSTTKDLALGNNRSAWEDQKAF